MKLGLSVTAVATAAASAAAAGDTRQDDTGQPVLTCTAALDGNDVFASADSRTKTFFIFSDTLMGTSDGEGKVSIEDVMEICKELARKG